MFNHSERYLDSDDADFLMQTVVEYVQFELLHPFKDGIERIQPLGPVHRQPGDAIALAGPVGQQPRPLRMAPLWPRQVVRPRGDSLGRDYRPDGRLRPNTPISGGTSAA